MSEINFCKRKNGGLANRQTTVFISMKHSRQTTQHKDIAEHIKQYPRHESKCKLVDRPISQAGEPAGCRGAEFRRAYGIAD
jgi:hypothetical protein